MQIKTTFINNFSPNELAKMQKFENTFHQQSGKETITLIHCWWECKMAQFQWRRIWQ